MENLTFEEAAVVAMYRKVSRKETISAIRETMEYLESDEEEIREILEGAIKKLKRMTEREFADADLFTPFDSAEDETDGG